MSELINREDAIEAMTTARDTHCISTSDGEDFISYDMAQNFLKELPPSKEWLLCSDRLPDDSGEYLVSVIDDEDEDYKHVGVAYFAHPNDYDIDKGEWRELMIDEKVIAWMPLPKPYHKNADAESEDKE